MKQWIIPLNEKYRIRPLDTTCITIERKNVNQKTKKEYWTARTYHANLRSAFSSIIDNSKIIIDIETEKKFEKWLNKINTIVNKVNKKEYEITHELAVESN